MRSIVTVVVVMGMLLCFCGVSFAGEWSGLLVLKNDVNFPKGKDVSATQQVCAWVQYKWIGLGVDLVMSADKKERYFQGSPYVTGKIDLKKWGELYPLVGFSGDDTGTDYVQTGFWYSKGFGKLHTFWDIRHYWAVKAQTTSYIDSFLEVKYPLTKNEKLFAGLDLEYIHYFEKDHDWYFVGPLVGYKFTKNIAFVVRASREWDVSHDGGTKPTDKIRTMIVFTF